MDNQRLLIWAFFGMMLWFTYTAWQQDYGPKPVEAPTPAAAEGEPTLPASDELALPEITESEDEVPSLSSAEPAVAEAAPEAAALITVTTDVLDLQISTLGGTLVHAALPAYPVAKDQPDVPVVLLSTTREELGLIRTGLRSADTTQAGPGHNAMFTAGRGDYELGDADELVVPLTWSDGEGLELEKRYRFTRGGYAIQVEQTLTNNSATPWRGDQYSQILRRSFELERSMFNVDSYSFDGPIVYDGDKSEKLDRDDLLDDGPFQYTADNGWVASIQHHFLSAMVPDRNAQHIYQVQVAGNTMRAR